jgi:4-hydroxybenzoate polyprenyltransferase
MKWTAIGEKKLLNRSFLFGLTGILLALMPLAFGVLGMDVGRFNEWLSGIGIALQLLGMSLAVLVIRQRRVAEEIQQKAKQMTLVLAVSLLFFILI